MLNELLTRLTCVFIELSLPCLLLSLRFIDAISNVFSVIILTRFYAVFNIEN